MPAVRTAAGARLRPEDVPGDLGARRALPGRGGGGRPGGGGGGGAPAELGDDAGEQSETGEPPRAALPGADAAGQQRRAHRRLPDGRHGGETERTERPGEVVQLRRRPRHHPPTHTRLHNNNNNTNILTIRGRMHEATIVTVQ